MKEITNITSDGVHYRDDEGNPQFIDFEICLQNYMKRWEKNPGSGITDEDRAFWQEAKYVGVRLALSDPPSIMFYTMPPVQFVFPTRKNLDEVLVGIKKAGWRTNDGE